MTFARMMSVCGIALAMSCGHTSEAPPPPNAVPATKPDHEVGAETGTPVASTPTGLMHDGAERKIQERLRAKGLLNEEQITGRLDDPTQEALRRFQKREGLPTTGLPSYDTIEHLDLKVNAIFRSRAHTEAPPRGSATKS